MSKYLDMLDRLKGLCCHECGGLGTINDAEPGDMYFNEYTCSKCMGSGFDPKACPSAPSENAMVKARKSKDRDVHTEHCCSKHGCKYNDRKCPVVLRKKIQSYLCEYCSNDAEELKETLT